MRRRGDCSRGSVRPRHKNRERAEELEGKNGSVLNLEDAATIAEEKSKPEAEIDVSAEDKKKMVKVLVRRALAKAINGVKCDEYFAQSEIQGERISEDR